MSASGDGDAAGAANGPGVAAECVEVGRIADAYGIKGWIKVQPYSGEVGGEPVGLLHAKAWWLGMDADAARRCEVEAVRLHSGSVVAKLAEVPDRTAAEALKGMTVWVARQELPATAADEFYWIDLIGCEVFGADQSLLGTVERIDDNGAHAILDVRGASGKRHAIPFVNAYVTQVDTQARRIATQWLESYSE